MQVLVCRKKEDCMVTKSPVGEPVGSGKKRVQEIPGLIRRALVRAGVGENEIHEFVEWAFDGEMIPGTFWELCVIWNMKFGSKLWLNITEVGSAEELDLFFFKMGRVFVEAKDPHQP